MSRENHHPCPADHAPFDVSPGYSWLSLLKCALLTYTELSNFQYHQVLCYGAVLSPLITQPVFVFGIALTQVQDLTTHLAEFHDVHASPSIKSVHVPLEDNPSLQHADHTTWPDPQTLHWSQYCPLRDTTHCCYPHGYWATDHNSSKATIQPIIYPTIASFVTSMSFHFRYKDVVWDCEMLCTIPDIPSVYPPVL